MVPRTVLKAEQSLFHTLSIYRYFSFMVAVGLTVTLPLLRGQTPPPEHYLALGVVGGYVVFSIFSPPHPRGFPGYFSLGLDWGVALGALMASGGLDSGLLLYSFTPTLTAALLLEEKAAYTLAGATPLALGMAHTLGLYSWLFQGHYLVLLMVYTIASVLLVVVPYRANLNLRRLLTQQATMAERQQTRRELHDRLAQELAFLNLKARQLRDSPTASPEVRQELEEIQKTLLRTYADVREYLDVLALGADFRLVAALRELGEGIAASGIEVEMELPQKGSSLSPMAQLQLVGIVREAMNNVRKHAQARHFRLTLRMEETGTELTIIDDGQGFNPEAVGPGHYGLRGMKERAEMVRGNLTISSTPGKGTQIRVVIPR